MRIIKKAELYNNSANLCVIVIMTLNKNTYEIELHTFSMKGEYKGNSRFEYAIYGAANNHYQSLIKLYL